MQETLAMQLPNFFIVGAMKAGTTSLYQHLRIHPDIFMSPVKEPRYFSPDCWDRSPGRLKSRRCQVYQSQSTASWKHSVTITEWNDYLRLFEPAQGQGKKAIGEATPHYLQSPMAPESISRQIPDARIIAILRNPLDRARSHHRMEAAIGNTIHPFMADMRRELDQMRQGRRPQLGLVQHSLYSVGLKRYYDLFGTERIRCYTFDDFTNRQSHVVQDICKFLEVESEEPCGTVATNRSRAARFKRLNYVLQQTGVKTVIRSTMPRVIVECGKKLFYTQVEQEHQGSGEDRQFLWEIFKDDILETQKIVGIPLTQWLPD